MLEIKRKICSGCGACKYACPRHAITMIECEEGFTYPEVNRDMCVDCGICNQICPQTKGDSLYNCESASRYYAGRNLNEEVVRTSSSGGIFDALARVVLEGNGYVYAVGLDENFDVRYYRIDDYGEINKLRGSKYVEAIFDQGLQEQLFDDIASGCHVLFVGTSCLVAGIRQICSGKNLDTSNVIFCDFFQCSGNTSRVLWREELKRISRRGHMKEISFRNKKNGWRNYSFHIQFDEGRSKNVNFLISEWGEIFGIPHAKRENCGSCLYNHFAKKSDVSLGDFWNSYAIPQEWKDNKGVSLVAVHSGKGEKFITEIRKYASLKPVERKVITWIQHKEVPDDSDSARNEFWKAYKREGFSFVTDTYCKVTLWDRISVSLIRNILIKSRLMELLDKKKQDDISQH